MHVYIFINLSTTVYIDKTVYCMQIIKLYRIPVYFFEDNPTANKLVPS